VRERGVQLTVDQRVVFAEILAALAMADDSRRCSEVGSMSGEIAPV